MNKKGDSVVLSVPFPLMVDLTVSDWSASGQLVDFIKRVEQRAPLSCDTVLKVFYQACRAVQHMHKQKPPVIHRDLKVCPPLVVGWVNDASKGWRMMCHSPSLNELSGIIHFVSWNEKLYFKARPAFMTTYLILNVYWLTRYFTVYFMCCVDTLQIENLLISNQGTIKLCDFGSSTTVSHYPDYSWSAQKRSMVEDEVHTYTHWNISLLYSQQGSTCMLILLYYIDS